MGKVSKKATTKPAVSDGRSYDNKLFVTMKLPCGLALSDTVAVHKKISHNSDMSMLIISCHCSPAQQSRSSRIGTQVDRDAEDVAQGLTTGTCERGPQTRRRCPCCWTCTSTQMHIAPPDTQTGQSILRVTESRVPADRLTRSKTATEEGAGDDEPQPKTRRAGSGHLRTLDGTATVTSKATTHDRSAGGSV